MALDDDIISGCPVVIRNFVRSNFDIEVYDYIQRGCNGEVYFGRRKKLNDEVVMKFYYSQPDYDASEEAAILKRIDHPNILKIWHLGLVDNRYSYFLTPKISGGDLQGQLDNATIATRKALEITAGILTGLSELHFSHLLVHRDLKPGNILIDLPSWRPIIADLGAVKKLADANSYVSDSKATRVYLPPEAILNNQYTMKSDIYQVGLILFQLLGGFFPIHDPIKWLTPKEAIKVNQIRNSIERENKFHELIDEKICKSKIANTWTLPKYLDSAFKKLLNKALQADPSSRLANASEFLKEIHKLINACPSYLPTSDYLHIEGTNGREFKLIEKKHGYFLEKKVSGKAWRRDNDHDGTYNSILLKIRNTLK
jgi:serine/threonine protein kinase